MYLEHFKLLAPGHCSELFISEFLTHPGFNDSWEWIFGAKVQGLSTGPVWFMDDNKMFWVHLAKFKEMVSSWLFSREIM